MVCVMEYKSFLIDEIPGHRLFCSIRPEQKVVFVRDNSFTEPEVLVIKREVIDFEQAAAECFMEARDIIYEM